MRPAGPAPTFGKRNLRAAKPAHPGADPHRAFFAAVRAEDGGTQPDGSRVSVPRSWRAGLLAGLVVACALAGVEATRNVAEMRELAEITEGRVDVRMIGPALILLAIAGGGRSAATALLLAHSALSWLGRTELWSYALAGAAAAACLAALIGATGLPIHHHGLGLEAAAGALGGFFYRVFAGTRAA